MKGKNTNVNINIDMEGTVRELNRISDNLDKSMTVDGPEEGIKDLKEDINGLKENVKDLIDALVEALAD